MDGPRSVVGESWIRQVADEPLSEKGLAVGADGADDLLHFPEDEPPAVRPRARDHSRRGVPNFVERDQDPLAVE